MDECTEAVPDHWFAELLDEASAKKYQRFLLYSFVEHNQYASAVASTSALAASESKAQEAESAKKAADSAVKKASDAAKKKDKASTESAKAAAIGVRVLVRPIPVTTCDGARSTDHAGAHAGSDLEMGREAVLGLSRARRRPRARQSRAHSHPLRSQRRIHAAW